MLTVTYTAAEHVAYTLSDHEVSDDVALRITLQKGAVEIEPDKRRSGDEAFDHNGMVVMVVDQGASEMLSEMTLDVATDDDGTHLILD